MSEEITRSGLLKDWVDSLPDLTAEQMRDIMAGISEMKLKRCDVLLGCDAPATWAANFHPGHPCHLFIGCQEHAQTLISCVMEELSWIGLYVCDECGSTFNKQYEAVSFWKV